MFSKKTLVFFLTLVCLVSLLAVAGAERLTIKVDGNGREIVVKAAPVSKAAIAKAVDGGPLVTGEKKTVSATNEGVSLSFTPTKTGWYTVATKANNGEEYYSGIKVYDANNNDITASRYLIAISKFGGNFVSVKLTANEAYKVVLLFSDVASGDQCEVLASEATVTADGYVYCDRDENGSTKSYITAYIGNAEDITLPEKIGGKSVSLKDYAFINAPIKSATFPNGDYSLSVGTFYGCASLKTVNLGSKTTSIGMDAFNGCASLENIDIPQSVSHISYNAFENCTSLKSIVLPDKVTTVYGNAFKGCSSLMSVTMPGVTRILNYAFDGCHANMTVYGYPGSYVQTWASENNYNFSPLSVQATQLTLGTPINEPATEGTHMFFFTPGESGWYTFSVTQGVQEQFYDLELLNEGLKNIAPQNGSNRAYANALSYPLSQGVKYYVRCLIKNSCADGAKVSVSVAKSLTSGDYVYHSCKGYSSTDELYIAGYTGSATTLALPEKIDGKTVAGLWNDVFAGTSIVSVTMPDSYYNLNSGVFANCKSLKSVSLPSRLGSLSYNMFSGCSSLESITLPANLWSISNSVFEDCSALKSIDIPLGIDSIYYGAFKGCSSLASVTMPGVTWIDSYAFDGCPANMTVRGYAGSYVETWAKKNNYTFVDLLDNLPKIEVGKNTVVPATADVHSFTFTPDVGGWHTILATDEASVGLSYYISINGIDYKGILKNYYNSSPAFISYNFEAGKRYIIDCKLWQAGADTDTFTLTASKNPQTTDGYVYYDIQSEWDPQSVNRHIIKYVGSAPKTTMSVADAPGRVYQNFVWYAVFSGTNVTEVVIPSEYYSIPNNTFADCAKLEKVTFKGSSMYINSTAFENCVSLKSFENFKSVYLIGYSAFKGCSSLTSLDMTGVSRINDGAFENCPSFTTVYGITGSYAETWANSNGKTFISTGEMGDVNGDGAINSTDVRLVLEHITRTIYLNTAQQGAADINLDGKITAHDAVLIMQKLPTTAG